MGEVKLQGTLTASHAVQLSGCCWSRRDSQTVRAIAEDPLRIVSLSHADYAVPLPGHLERNFNNGIDHRVAWSYDRQ